VRTVFVLEDRLLILTSVLKMFEFAKREDISALILARTTLVCNDREVSCPGT
jgi:hypothetical protein